MEVFGLESTQAMESFMFDQDNFPIPVDLFPVVIPQFFNPATYIKIVFNFHEDVSFDLVRFLQNKWNEIK